jgi:hypothetical protein
MAARSSNSGELYRPPHSSRIINNDHSNHTSHLALAGARPAFHYPVEEHNRARAGLLPMTEQIGRVPLEMR